MNSAVELVAEVVFSGITRCDADDQAGIERAPRGEAKRIGSIGFDSDGAQAQVENFDVVKSLVGDAPVDSRDRIGCGALTLRVEGPDVDDIGFAGEARVRSR